MFQSFNPTESMRPELLIVTDINKEIIKYDDRLNQGRHKEIWGAALIRVQIFKIFKTQSNFKYDPKGKLFLLKFIEL